MSGRLFSALSAILGSKPYKAFALVYRTDAKKVAAELAGSRCPNPGSLFAQGLVWIARVAWELKLKPPPPPPPAPPPPAYLRVAPRVAFKEGGSDARFCTVNQPGVVQEPDEPVGHTIDECGATYDSDGLCKNGRRSDGPALTGALQIDGRAYCNLPTFGSPTLNTGSWQV